MEKAIEHGADGGNIAEQLSPVLDGTVGSEQRAEALVAAHDNWEERWADTRIHGTTKRQVAAMFAEERPILLPLPLEPFR